VPDLPESAQVAVAAIRRGGDRIERVVADLLALHGTADAVPASGGRVDLGALAAEVVALNAALAASLGTDLRVVRPPEPVVAGGDAGDVDHVVTNLVSNALKYTPAGGRVVVSVASVDGEATLAVTDDGIGIAAEDLPRLFEEFYRSADPAAAGQPGTGLGLAIVRRFVERHGGRVEVDSELGVGSTFRVILPLG
jgi:signal transduction histidine kinase